jgi:FtsP/CotA-like multicopper oxidase with cupredoxin domain
MTVISRRGFLGVLGGSALGAASFGPLLVSRPGQTGQLLRSRAPLPKPFTVPLPVPPVAKPVRADATGDVYRIVQREVDLEILPGLRTKMLCYDGSFPGPTILSRGGRQTVVHHRNELTVPTTTHLHGGHTPADSDGWPMDLVARKENVTTPTRAGSVRRRSGTTTTGWTTPARRSIAA